MTESDIIGITRKKFGTGISRSIRRDGMLPAVVYGFSQHYSLSLVYKEVFKKYQEGGFLSKILNIRLGNKLLTVLPLDLQIDPVTDQITHIDFQLVKDNIPVKVNVLVKVVNKDKSPGLKKGGVLNLIKKYVRLISIPKCIPNCLEIDISGYEIGKTVSVNHIKLPNGVTFVRKEDYTILTIAGRVEEKDEEEKDQVDSSDATDKNGQQPNE